MSKLEDDCRVKKKNLVYEKFRIGVRRKRAPLSESTVAYLREQRMRHNEYFRRCDWLKDNSGQTYRD
ncbi:hypothetical protein HNV12_00100 [Methanococcoides sp. SA1]|nr:hypothetical protein [Methanococcoides sp. SA1]